MTSQPFEESDLHCAVCEMNVEPKKFNNHLLCHSLEQYINLAKRHSYRVTIDQIGVRLANILEESK